MLLSFCLIFFWFEPGVAYKNAAYEKACIYNCTTKSVPEHIAKHTFTYITVYCMPEIHKFTRYQKVIMVIVTDQNTSYFQDYTHLISAE